MKNNLLVLTFAFSLFTVLSQSHPKWDLLSKSHLLTFSFSNNGQLKDEIDEFYFFKGSYTPNDDVHFYKQTEFKFNLQYEYFTERKFSFRGRFGVSNRRDSYDISNWNFSNGYKKQHCVNVSFGSNYNYQIGNLIFSSGLEIPFFSFSPYTEKLISKDPNLNLESTIHIDGGFVYGLNSINSVRLFISERFYFSSDVTFGFLQYNLGGEMYESIIHQDPAMNQEGVKRKSTYNKLTFSKPELNFGIGWKF